MKVDSLISVKIKMKKGNPYKWVRRSEEAIDNQYLLWLVPKEQASILQISSINDLKKIAEALNIEIDIIEVIKEE